MNCFIISGIIILVSLGAEATAAPSIFDVQVGNAFPGSAYSTKSDRIDTYPTVKFKVPNSGVLSELFPEYEVTIIRETNKIYTINAYHTYERDSECLKNGEILKKWVVKKFKYFKYSKTLPNYSSKKEGIIVNVGCMYRDGSPYPSLEYHVREKTQDEYISEAWNEFLKKTNAKKLNSS